MNYPSSPRDGGMMERAVEKCVATGLIHRWNSLQIAKAIMEIVNQSFPPCRSLGRWDFEDGSFVQISASTELSTQAALEMIETLTSLKRSEMSRTMDSA